jgi:hypothetical protein
VKKSLGIVLLFLTVATAFIMFRGALPNYAKLSVTTENRIKYTIISELPKSLVAGLEGMVVGLIIGAIYCIVALIITYVRFHVRPRRRGVMITAVRNK